MKMLSILVLVLFSLSAHAAKWNDYFKVSETSDYVSFKNGYDTKYVFIKGLQHDLFQSLVIRDSRGPGWKDNAIDFLDGITDFHEHSSYYGERLEVFDCEGWSEEDFENVDYATYELRWKSVKNKTGSQKTRLYILEHYTVISTPGQSECESLDQEFVFRNSGSKDPAKRYIGRREYSIPTFK